MGLIDWLTGQDSKQEAYKAVKEHIITMASNDDKPKVFVAHSDGTITPPDSKEYRRKEE